MPNTKKPADDTAGDDTDEVAIAEATPAEGAIAEDWADAYPEGAELFCGQFDAEDFDTDYATAEYPDGETIAVQRLAAKPTPGWIRKHQHLSDLERTFVLLEKHAAPEALEILDDLTTEAWDEFVSKWGEDGGLIPKSTRSSRRAKRTRRRSDAT